MMSFIHIRIYEPDYFTKDIVTCLFHYNHDNHVTDLQEAQMRIYTAGVLQCGFLTIYFKLHIYTSYVFSFESDQRLNRRTEIRNKEYKIHSILRWYTHMYHQTQGAKSIFF